MLYIDNMDLVPLQLLLYKIISNIQFVLQNSFYLASEGGGLPDVATEATCVIAIAPMLLHSRSSRNICKRTDAGFCKGLMPIGNYYYV